MTESRTPPSRASASTAWLRAAAVRGVAMALLWWAIAEGDRASWWVASVAILAATGVSLLLMSPRRGARLAPGAVLRFAAYFLAHALRAGVQVAWMALCPRLRLAPACVDIPLHLPPGGARILLCYAMSLMPGSLCIATAADSVLVHVLDHRLPHAATARALERRIAAIWRLPA